VFLFLVLPSAVLTVRASTTGFPSLGAYAVPPFALIRLADAFPHLPEKFWPVCRLRFPSLQRCPRSTLPYFRGTPAETAQKYV